MVEADIGDADRVRPLLKSIDIIFNVAGEVSHTHSMEFPERDLELNTRSQLSFLQPVRPGGAGSPGGLHVYPPGLREAGVSAS